MTAAVGDYGGLFLVRRWLATRAEPGFDLAPVRFVVFVHHGRNVAQCHWPHAFLNTRAQPVARFDLTQGREVGRAGLAEGDDGGAERPGPVVALPGDLRAVEIRQHWVALVKQSSDADGVTFALEVRKMPALLDRRRLAVLPAFNGLGLVEPGERDLQKVGHG